MPGAIMSGIANLVNSGAGIAQGVSNYELQKKAYKDQKEYNEWTKDYTMNRNFYTVQDLARAGFSPAALLNQGAGNAQVLSSASAPQFDFSSAMKSLRNIPLDVVSVSNSIAETDKKKQEEVLIRKQQFSEVSRNLNIIADTALKNASSDKVRADIEKIKKEMENLDVLISTGSYNLDYSVDKGFRTTDSLNPLFNTLHAAAENLDSDLLGVVVDALMFFIPGMGLLKGAKLLPNLKAILPYLSKGKDYVIKNWNKLRGKVKELPVNPSDFFG